MNMVCGISNFRALEMKNTVQSTLTTTSGLQLTYSYFRVIRTNFPIPRVLFSQPLDHINYKDSIVIKK